MRGWKRTLVVVATGASLLGAAGAATAATVGSSDVPARDRIQQRTHQQDRDRMHLRTHQQDQTRLQIRDRSRDCVCDGTGTQAQMRERTREHARDHLRDRTHVRDGAGPAWSSDEAS